MFVRKLRTPSCANYEHVHVYLAKRRQTRTVMTRQTYDRAPRLTRPPTAHISRGDDGIFRDITVSWQNTIAWRILQCPHTRSLLVSYVMAYVLHVMYISDQNWFLNSNYLIALNKVNTVASFWHFEVKPSSSLIGTKVASPVTYYTTV